MVVLCTAARMRYIYLGISYYLLFGLVARIYDARVSQTSSSTLSSYCCGLFPWLAIFLLGELDFVLRLVTIDMHLITSEYCIHGVRIVVAQSSILWAFSIRRSSYYIANNLATYFTNTPCMQKSYIWMNAQTLSLLPLPKQFYRLLLNDPSWSFPEPSI